MFKDITLGQFFPGDSAIHRLDPRAKIIFTFLYILIIFFVDNFSGYIALAVFITIIICVSGIPARFIFKGLKSILILMCITALLNVFLTGGRVLFTIGPATATYEGVHLAVFMILRIIFLIVGTSLLTLTTSPITLTDGIESLLSPLKRIGVPAHELAMMMTIALRFIPTLLEETEKIIKAQTARGADFESGNLIKRAKGLVPLLVPLFISAFRRADELAMAMECRCYRGGDNRTRMKQLSLSRIDFFAGGAMVALAAVIAVCTRLAL